MVSGRKSDALLGNEPDVIAFANPSRPRAGKQPFVNFFGASLQYSA
jgi:hypothetical protein